MLSQLQQEMLKRGFKSTPVHLEKFQSIDDIVVGSSVVVYPINILVVKAGNGVSSGFTSSSISGKVVATTVGRVQVVDDCGQSDWYDWRKCHKLVSTAAIVVKSKIVHRDGKWHVYSEDGKKHLGGPYGTKDEAVKRLRQVEYFKHKG